MLSSLSLSQFRSYRRAGLSLDGRPVAIWGANGAGKTSLLEAVSLLSPGRGLRRAGPEELARRPEVLGWRVRAEVAGREVETGAEGSGAREVRLDGKPAPQAALGRLLRVVWLTPAMDRIWIEPAEGRRRFLDRLVLSFTPAHGEAVLAYEKAMRERNRLLKDMVRDAGWYLALETQMAEAGEAITRARMATLARLASAQAGAETAFPAAELRLLAAEGEPALLADDLRVAYAEGRARDMAAGRTLAGPHRADLAAVYSAKGAAAALCSTGEQKALLISLILANARALAEDGTPPLVLLDEVAAHLDSARRAALYDEVCALGLQALMTGTGPELFDSLAGRAQGLVVREEAGESRIEEARP